jgi:glycosyltransferase involved in cell wall biosynthesis
LLHVFPSFAVGGAQMRFAELVKAHGERYRHTVFALDGMTDMSARIAGDAAIEYRTLTFDKGSLWRNLALFRKTMNDIAADVLVTYNWGAIEWALANRFGKRLAHVHIEDGFGPEEANRQLRRRVWTRRLALSGRHTTVVLPSRGLERIAREVWKLPAERIVHIPNGIDCARFATGDAAARPQGTLVLGTLATLRKEKNLVRLIEAFSAIAADWPRDGLHLLIVGDGPERQHLEDATRRSSYAGQIRFAGATTQAELWYRQMDVFALSSDTEQMPFSVLEAMAAGRPIVSPAVGDVAELVSPENAPFIKNAQDEAAYRAALSTILRDPRLRHTLGEANRRKAVAEFDQHLMSERYGEVFDRSALGRARISRNRAT